MTCDLCKASIRYNTTYYQGNYYFGNNVCQWCVDQGIVREKGIIKENIMSATFEDIKKLYQKKVQEKLVKDHENDTKIRQGLLNEIYKRLDEGAGIPLKELKFDYNDYNELMIYKNHFLHLGFKIKEDNYSDDHDSNYDRYGLIVSGWA